MGKFDFIIVNTNNGEVCGTNNSIVAYELSDSDEYFVIDTINETVIFNKEESHIKELVQNDND